ncbi:MAG: anthranilate synthase component I, partial [Planctomycetota bacterium]|nr:anthranilate synthase component I [Planctomycetota bacterium]
MNRDTFGKLAKRGNVIALSRRLMSDQLTPVLAYRRLVSADERTAPSFLLESIEGGDNVGRHSFLGAHPILEVLAMGHEVKVIDHRTGETTDTIEDDPLSVPKRLARNWKLAGFDERESMVYHPPFIGGWVGYAGYDTVRYFEPEKLPFESAPPDDRNLPDLHFGLYRQVGVFDHVSKVLHAYVHVMLDEYESVDEAYTSGMAELDQFVSNLETHNVPLPAGPIDLDPLEQPTGNLTSNFTREEFEQAVERCREYIGAGDAFQIVISQRFERTSSGS